MSEWFKTAFGSDYLSLYAHRDSAEATLIVDTILGKTGLKQGSLVCDAPCGGGRHLAAFRARGMRTVGFDLSMPLLQEAAGTAGQRGHIARADLRHIPFLRGRCDMVVNLFSSLGYFEQEETNLRVLYDLVEVTRRKGWVVVDFMHSNYLKAHLRSNSERVTGAGTTVRDKRWIGGALERVNKQTEITYADGRTDVITESVRLFSPEELRRALADSGVSIEFELGSYSGDAFSSSSERIILLGTRR